MAEQTLRTRWRPEEPRGKSVISTWPISRKSNPKLKACTGNGGGSTSLINNAGITRDTLLMRMKEEDWDRVMAINLKGVFNCTQAVIRSMIKNKSGKIVNYRFGVGGHGKCRTGQLCRFQGRGDRIY